MHYIGKIDRNKIGEYGKKITKLEKNIQIVIKLQRNREDIHKSNTVLTLWHLRKRTYNSEIKNNKILYKKE